MSLQLLKKLNGNNDGPFRKFISEQDDSIRIAWYPSSGLDFRCLFYLNPVSDSTHPFKPGTNPPASPGLFLYTDYFGLRTEPEPGNQLYLDKRTRVTIETVEELPALNLDVDQEIVTFSKNEFTNRVFYLTVTLESNLFGQVGGHILYACAVNEAFCAKILLPNKAKISHLIHIRYGSGFGGARGTGSWLLNVLEKLGCELFIHDNHHEPESGDFHAIHCYPNLAKSGPIPEMELIRTIQSEQWSDHGDVGWYLVGRVSGDKT